MKKNDTRRGAKTDTKTPKGGGRAFLKALNGRSQVSAAKILGVTPGHVNHLIRGRKTPTLRLAKKINEYFDVPIEVWLD